MKRKRKHCLHKRRLRLADSEGKNLLAAYFTSWDKVEAYHTKTLESLNITRTQAHIIAETPLNWSVLLCIIGLDFEGRRYIKSEWLGMKARYRQRDLVEYLNDRQKEYVERAANLDQLEAVGWIASPVGLYLESEQALKIYEKGLTLLN